MAQTVREVMSTDPITLSAGAPARRAAEAMRDSNIGDVIVLDDSERVCGIVTDRDLAVRVIAEGRDPSQTRVGEVCSRELVTLTPGDSVGDAVRVMSEKAIRRIPVVENGRAVGVVALGDLAVTQDPESALADISASPPNR